MRSLAQWRVSAHWGADGMPEAVPAGVRERQARRGMPSDGGTGNLRTADTRHTRAARLVLHLAPRVSRRGSGRGIRV